MASLEEVILAAMFHDIGKFGQRAGAERSDQLIETYCRKYRGYHTHLHVLNTDHFLENILPLPACLGLDRQTIAKMAANHHKPEWSVLEESCLVIADFLASGADRYKDEEQNEEKGYIRDRLVSIFEEIELQRHKFDVGEAQTYRLCPIDEDPYPKKLEKPDAKKGQDEYHKHWQAFTEHLKNNEILHSKELSFNQYLGALCTSLEKYLWCVPAASFNAIPDISLYDHGYLTASIAQALYRYHEEMGSKPYNTIDDKNVEKFMLYGGDLSGIQNYIFDINKSHAAGVAKLYRARSFYLQMVTKSLVLELLERLDLYTVALVMDAAGKFMLLLPNTDRVQQTTIEFEQELERVFLKSFKGRLTLNTVSVTASFNDLLLEQFNSTLNRFFDELEKQKLRKFRHFLASEKFDPLIQDELYVHDYDGHCQICEIEIINQNSSNRFAKQFKNDSYKVCKTCYQQVCIIGRDLPQEEKIYFYLSKSKELRHETSDLLLKWKICFLKEDDLSSLDLIEPRGFLFNRKQHKDYAFHPVAGHMPLMDQGDVDYWEKNLRKKDKEEESMEVCAPKTFEMIAHSDKHVREIRGKAFLGALKADVDNLGFIFSIGFENKEHTKLSISRFASLSRMLNYFFSVKLVETIRDNFPNIYVIFAGGDDLFFLGPWVELIRFSEILREKFTRFTAYNRDITLSAGLGVYKPALPVRNIAHSAEELLEQSKQHPLDQDVKEKNAVTLFDETVNWERFAELIRRGDQLNDFLNQEVLSTGFVYRLLNFSREQKKFMEGNVKAGIYVSRMSYDFARNITSSQFNKKEYDEHAYQDFMKWKDDRDYLSNANIPLHYSLYKNRMDGEEYE